MRVLTVLLSAILVCVSAWAQPSPINRRAMAIAGLASSVSISGPTNIASGALYWYVSSDVAVGVTLSNQWADRIQGILMQNLSGTLNPTNSSKGMRFNVNGFCTNSPGTDAGFNWAPAGNVGAQWWVVNLDSTVNKILAASVADTHGIWTESGPNLAYGGGHSGGPNNVFKYAAATNFDFGMVLTTTNTIWYTNGIPCVTNSSAGTDNYIFGSLGDFGNGFGSSTGYVIESIGYTNYLTAQNFSDLHKYGTNLYNYAP